MTINHDKWVLLVDDNACDADLALRELTSGESASHVVVARDGAEALDCLHQRGGFNTRQTGNPVLVLLDLKMPKVNGLEVLQELKTDPEPQTIPVVMLTSSCEPTDVLRSYELGANAYVVKPVDYQAFRAAIRRVGAFWVATNQTSPGMPPVSGDGSTSVEVAA